MPKIKPLTNPYKLQRVQREEEEEAPPRPSAPHPGIEPGDDVFVSPAYKNLFFYIPSPTSVLSVMETKHCVSGWMIGVKAIRDGKEVAIELDSGYISKVKP